MNEIDTAAPAAAGGSVAPMIVPAGLSERIGRGESRRALLDEISRQRLLFSRMAERLGIAAPVSPLMRAVLREAECGCLECTVWCRCRQWLDNGSPDDDYREFCPNEGFFAVLPRVATQSTVGTAASSPAVVR